MLNYMMGLTISSEYNNTGLICSENYTFINNECVYCPPLSGTCVDDNFFNYTLFIFIIVGLIIVVASTLAAIYVNLKDIKYEKVESLFESDSDPDPNEQIYTH